MALSQTVRLNNAANRNRSDDFEARLKRVKCEAADIHRHLVDAWNEYVDTYGVAPSVPIKIAAPGGVKKTTKGAAKKGKAS